ncbi:peptidoglycan-associated lipoprotein [Paraperlucidibaca baekdonensis]|uniref:Peptidoglycan-associated lipoprotein n=1 Tax=Paraperlucidibaca baekdonensis TaxID=748120 RepID=A0A3E0H3E6_9GAMM|nr:peptidoglycan-associated lipoprotein Pal [Paraperlucidibaca baekdonensis]REH36775.1 peptidoglycan-associated lipoprotein [Paraperlucidibaca baekdonensis]
MKIAKSVKLATVGLIIVSLSACSIFRGPRPINPNDDAQFENLPPAPAIEAVTPIAEDMNTMPETGSANLGNPIEGNVIADSTTEVISTDSLASSADLLRVRVYYFGTNLSDITAIAYGGLNAHAQYLINNPNTRLQLSGHTDERGTREYNLALGERRANAVARYLVSAGVNAGQLTVVSYGKEKPVVDGSYEEAWAQNRRVELDYVSGSPN